MNASSRSSRAGDPLEPGESPRSVDDVGSVVPGLALGTGLTVGAGVDAATTTLREMPLDAPPALALLRGSAVAQLGLGIGEAGENAVAKLVQAGVNILGARPDRRKRLLQCPDEFELFAHSL